MQPAKASAMLDPKRAAATAGLLSDSLSAQPQPSEIAECDFCGNVPKVKGKRVPAREDCPTAREIKKEWSPGRMLKREDCPDFEETMFEAKSVFDRETEALVEEEEQEEAVMKKGIELCNRCASNRHLVIGTEPCYREGRCKGCGTVDFVSDRWVLLA